MKVYEAVFKEGEIEGVYALSVVEDPAMQDTWIALSEHPQKIELATIDEDKRLLLGAALIPNKKIYRNIDGHEFYLTFSEETIEKLWHSFFKNQHNNNSSLEHEIQLEGMSVVEGWVVEDSEKDKSANFGKSYPKGTAVAMMKVDNDEMWNKVKQGEIKGFSIDALLQLQEVNFKSNINMFSIKDLESLKALFSSNSDDTIGGDKVEEQEQVEVKTDEVAEVTETEQPQEEAQEVSPIDAIKEILAEFKKENDAKIDELRAEFSKQVEEKEAKVEELEVELSKKPEVEAIKPKPQVEVKPSEANSIKGRVFANLQNVWQ